MGSPVFWSHILTKVAAHYVMTLSVTVANDMMMNSVNAKEVGYDKLQTQFEVTRGVTRTVFTSNLLEVFQTTFLETS